MPILNDRTEDFVSNSPEQTTRLGVRLGELLQAKDCLCLAGDMGAGKTAFARGVGRGWGTTHRVTSPTYVLVNENPRPHDGRILYHIDAYRLETPGDVATSGIPDILEELRGTADRGGAVMIEWPERLQPYLPSDHLWIAFTYQSETRRSLRFSASGKRATEILHQFKRKAFGA